MKIMFFLFIVLATYSIAGSDFEQRLPLRIKKTQTIQSLYRLAKEAGEKISTGLSFEGARGELEEKNQHMRDLIQRRGKRILQKQFKTIWDEFNYNGYELTMETSKMPELIKFISDMTLIQPKSDIQSARIRIRKARTLAELLSTTVGLSHRYHNRIIRKGQRLLSDRFDHMMDDFASQMNRRDIFHKYTQGLDLLPKDYVEQVRAVRLTNTFFNLVRHMEQEMPPLCSFQSMRDYPRNYKYLQSYMMYAAHEIMGDTLDIILDTDPRIDAIKIYVDEPKMALAKRIKAAQSVEELDKIIEEAGEKLDFSFRYMGLCPSEISIFYPLQKLIDEKKYVLTFLDESNIN